MIRYWKECTYAESELELDIDDDITRPDASRHISGVMSKVNINSINEDLDKFLIDYVANE